jgi:hypothetical protein
LDQNGVGRTSGYLTKQDVDDIVNHHTFRGQQVTDENVIAGAEELYSGGTYAGFDQVDDMGSGNHSMDGKIASWDFPANVTNSPGPSTSAPAPSTSAPSPSTSAPAPSTSGAGPSTSNPNVHLTQENIKATDLISVYGNDPMNSVINDIKTKSSEQGLYVTRQDVRRAADLETDPNKRAIFNWIYNHFDDIDHAGGRHWHGDAGLQHGSDGKIGAHDLEKYFGW